MSDLTILFYTANQKPEPFAAKVRQSLLNAIGDLPLVCVSHPPLEYLFGNRAHPYITIAGYPVSTWTCYYQILKGAEAANTRYVAMAEDDVLYPAEHYQWRPSTGDVFYYNKNRWWIEMYEGQPRYRWRDRTVMATGVCNRELLIETLRTRFAKFPKPLSREEATGWAEPGRYEPVLGLPQVNIGFFETRHPIVTFNTKPSLGGIRRSNPSDKIAQCLEPWGEVSLLWKEFDA